MFSSVRQINYKLYSKLDAKHDQLQYTFSEALSHCRMQFIDFMKLPYDYNWPDAHLKTNQTIFNRNFLHFTQFSPNIYFEVSELLQFSLAWDFFFFIWNMKIHFNEQLIDQKVQTKNYDKLKLVRRNDRQIEAYESKIISTKFQKMNVLNSILWFLSRL